jgi:ABC-type nickel/cobalt efflux system permease component RcnA
MLEGLFYLMASFWLGAVHAATPGHGKTIAASYIVGVRGRPIDALVLGVFVTLSHTSGIVLVAVLATLGSAWLIPQRVEAYLAIGTGILVVGIGCWMLRTQLLALALAMPAKTATFPTSRLSIITTAKTRSRPARSTRTLIRTLTAPPLLGLTITATDGVWSTSTTSRPSPKPDRASPCCSA